MPDNLRDRIAAALGKHWAGASGSDCKCGWKTAPLRALSDDYEKHLADAVMEVLKSETGQLLGWARDCVLHGDMTPAAERVLGRILAGHDE